MASYYDSSNLWEDNTGSMSDFQILDTVLGFGQHMNEAANPIANQTVQNTIISAKNNLESYKQSLMNMQQAETYEDLLNMKKDFKPLNLGLTPDLGNKHNAGLNIFQGALSGAQTGSIGGPWGALGGAVSGAIGTSLAELFGDGESEKQEVYQELKDKENEYDTYAQNFFDMNAQNINSKNYRNMLANIAAFGGYIGGNGGDWTDGLTFINVGGSHEQNPYGGVPMGIAPDGQPNLVEEGEVVWNDYVFSDRIKVPKETIKEYKLKGKKDMTFAEAITNLQKSAEKRPNDPIEQQGLNTTLMKLAMEQEAIRQQQARKEENALMEEAAAYAADGGPIHIAKNKRGTFTAAATKHGKSVQEFASQVLANPENYSPAMVKKANFARNAAGWNHAFGGHLFNEGGHWKDGKFYNEQGVEQPNPFVYAPEENEGNTDFSIPGTEYYSTPEDAPKKKDKMPWETYLRYAPVLGSAIGALTSVFDKPNYSYARTLENAANAYANSIPNVSYKPLNDYLAYKPMDRMFYANELGAHNAATRSAILGSMNANRQAAINNLLAADYNANIGLGKLYREGFESNLAQRQRVAEFNRGTRQYNSQAALDASKANANLAQARANMRLGAEQSALAMMNQEDQLIQAARSKALTNLFNNIGAVGKESWIFKMIEDNPALMYAYLNGANGSMGYKGNNG